MIVAEKYREAVHGDEMLPKAAAGAVEARIPYEFGVNDFTIVRRAWKIGPEKTGSKEQLPKSDGYCVYSPAFKQFVYRPKLVDRIVEAVSNAEDFQQLLGRAPAPKSAH